MSDDVPWLVLNLIISPASKPRGRPVDEERHVAVRLAFTFFRWVHNMPLMKARAEVARLLDFHGEREVRRKLNQAGGVLEAGSIFMIGTGHKQDGTATPLHFNIERGARCVESNPGEFTVHGSFWAWSGGQLKASYYPKGSTLKVVPKKGTSSEFLTRYFPSMD